MRLFAALLVAVPCVPHTRAVFSDEAFHVDYHHALLGIPQEHTTFFHRPHSTSNASLLYTISEKLVLGAVNPRSGTLVWRQKLGQPSYPGQNKAFLRAGDVQNTVVSAVGGEVTAWDALDGRAAWKASFEGEPARGLEIAELEEGVTSPKPKDSIVLFGEKNAIVRRLDGETGSVKWEYKDESGDIPFQVSTSTSSIHYISLHPALIKGYKVKVTSLDPVSGVQTAQHMLSSDSEVSSADSVLFVGSNTASPLIVYTDKGHKALKINVIGSKHINTINIDNRSGEEIEKIIVHAPRTTCSVPHFLVHYQTAKKGWAEVYHADLKASTVSKAYSLPLLQEEDAFSTSTRDANVYFTRITGSEVSLVSSASHGMLGRWSRRKDVVYETLHAVSEVVARGDSTFAVRAALVQSSGDWKLVRDGESVWTRPESLANAVAAEWVELDDGESLAHELEVEGHQSLFGAYIHRVKRHARDLQQLPSWLRALPQRIFTSFINAEAVDQDASGSGKAVIVATDNGRVFLIDARKNGSIMLNTKAVDLAGAKWKVKAILVEGKTASIIAEDRDVVEINVADGDVIGSRFSPSREVKSVVLVPHTSSPLAVGVRGDGTPSSSEAIEDGTIVVTLNNDGQAQGWRYGGEPVKIWDFRPSPGQKIISAVARPLQDPVASIGKVLGNRSVLYKYLNPNLALLTAASEKIITVYLLDSISGQVLHTMPHNGTDTTIPVPSVLSENWFAYSFWSDGTDSSSKGHQLVIAELYESFIPNDRGPLESSANFSSIYASASPTPHVISQSFVIPEGISHMAVTQTLQGITSRQLICTLPESNAVIGIPRHLLDPRRPIDRDPTANEAEEGLMKYSPILNFDAKWYLTHARDLMGIRRIISTPTLLESTTLIFAFGLDAFGTRLAPSGAFDILGKGFNKVQLLATILALGVGVGFLAPMVRRKQIDSRWKMS